MASRTAGCLLAVMLLVSGGCSTSYHRWHESPLLSVYASGPAEAGGPGAAARARARAEWASFIEAQLLKMVDEFQVPLADIVPVSVYHDGDESTGKSYYNSVTGAIVLRGDLDRAACVHELSHLLAHRVVRSPPYWSDQALAEYMETRFAEPRPSRERLTGAFRPPDRVRRLTRRVASAESPSEVLDHLSRSAVDESRGWGLVLVFYLFEERWAGDDTGKKIRRLLSLSPTEVEALAPALVEYCRSRETLAGADVPAAR